MTSNPFTRALLIDNINSIIGTSLTTTWTDTKINQLLDQALSEISEAVPYVMVDIYQLETRSGIATSTSSGNLVDATNAQFVSTAVDAGKVVYNTTDKTWAVIESVTSTSIAVLSKDIFTVGEGYEIYNKGCWNKKQINISDSGDFLWVLGAVYPVEPDLMLYGATENMKNVKLLSQNKIAEIDTWWVDNTKDSDAYKDVQLYLARQHKLNLMTGLTGAAKAAWAASATSGTVDGLTDADPTVFKDTLFTVALASGISSRLTYRVTADAAIDDAEEAIISFFPSLEAAVDADAVVTFIGSTLTPDLERILIDIATGQILMAEGISQVNEISKGGSTVSTRTFDMGRNILERARMQLRGLVDVELRANKILAR